MKLIANRLICSGILIILVLVFLNGDLAAQESMQMVRIARIKVDPAQLGAYTKALKEQMETAVRTEPGVLFYHAVADQKDPARITILEVYASVDAYRSHIETIHFKRYKEAVKDMVKELVLEDVKTLAKAKKEGF